jgi:hypothetical protein
MIPVFSFLDTIQGGSHQLYAAAVQYPFFSKLESQIQAGLPSHGGQEAIRSLPFDNPLQKFNGKGFYINSVSNLLIRHNRRRI